MWYGSRSVTHNPTTSGGSAAAHGVMDAAGETGVPMAFGVLTTNSVEEALERAVAGDGNKGREAAQAALETAELEWLAAQEAYEALR